MSLVPGADDSGEKKRHFSFDDLQDLPEPVQRYFKYCMTEGQPLIKYCAIKQQGWFRYLTSSHAAPVCSVHSAAYRVACPCVAHPSIAC